MANITLKHTFKKFPGDVIAVKDFNLEIQDKEFLVLVGPSGLRQIHHPAHDRRPGGDYRGRNLHRRPAGQRRSAQGPGYRHGFPELRPLPAHDGLREHGLRPEAAKIPKDEINSGWQKRPTSWASSNCCNRKPKELSGGQRQRVAVGRPSCASPRSSSSTNRSPTWTPRLRVADARGDHQAAPAAQANHDLRHP